jgi:hypothetical protein
MKCFLPPYDKNEIDSLIHHAIAGTEVVLFDHLGGFDANLTNCLLVTLTNQIEKLSVSLPVNFFYCQILDDVVKNNYSNLNIEFDFREQHRVLWVPFASYNQHPDINYRNFICSFNGSDHISRKLLVAILEKFGYFTTNYCSKNFVFTKDKLDGHITDYVGDQDNFYRKFFIADNSDVFFNKVNSFGHTQYDHKQNIYNLESKITQSFLHIVSETMATSYVPFVTEKFLYSIVTRGLFLSYAQPGWHDHVEKYYGFKKYTKLFDYRFDAIQNPIERLVELMTMISKFAKLSTVDWHDLYQLEADTIEYNYDHYFSEKYLNCLKKYETN